MIEEIKGLRELHDALQALPVKVEKNILRGMIRAGSKVIADEARAKAPILKEEDPRRWSGALKKSVRIMSTIFKNGSARGGVAEGGRANAKSFGGLKVLADAFYAKWVEYGTVKMAAQPFMRPAGDSKSGAAVEAGAAYVRERVNAGDLK